MTSSTPASIGRLSPTHLEAWAMRKASGVTLGLFGIAILSIPGGLLVWAYRQYTIGLSGKVTAIMVGLVLTGLACLFAIYQMLRGRIPD